MRFPAAEIVLTGMMVVALPLLSACDTGESNPSVHQSAAGTSPDTSSENPDPATNETAAPAGLPLSPDLNLLVDVTSGQGNAPHTFTFKNTRKYDIYTRCQGKKGLKIVTQDGSYPIACDDVPGRLQILADPSTVTLRLTADPATTWLFAVAEGT